MSYPVGSFQRMTLAALLAPLGPALCALPILQSWEKVPGRSWGIHGTRDLLLAWLALALLVSVVGLILRAWRRVELHHHLLAMLVIGTIPMLLTLLAWSGTDDLTRSCADLLSPTGFDLPARVTLALLVPTAGIAYKWLAYGFDPARTGADGWRIAGAVYLLMLAIDIGGQIGQMSAPPLWQQLVRQNCE